MSICPKCKTPYTEEDRTCPLCGLDFSALTPEDARRMYEAADAPAEGAGENLFGGDGPVCPHCGMKNDPGAEICFACRGPIQNDTEAEHNETPLAEKDEDGTENRVAVSVRIWKGWIIILAVVLVVAAGGLAWGLRQMRYQSSPAHTVIALIEDRKPIVARKQYDQTVKDNAEHRAIFLKELPGCIDRMAYVYDPAGEARFSTSAMREYETLWQTLVTFDEAVQPIFDQKHRALTEQCYQSMLAKPVWDSEQYYDVISYLRFFVDSASPTRDPDTLTYIQTRIDDLQEISAARIGNFYQNGCTLLEQGKYAEARAVLAQIPESDPNYADAQAKLLVCLNDLREDLLQTNLTLDFYPGALVELIELDIADMLQYFPDDPELLALRDQAKLLFRNQVLNTYKEVLTEYSPDSWWTFGYDPTLAEEYLGYLNQLCSYFPDDSEAAAAEQEVASYYMHLLARYVTDGYQGITPLFPGDPVQDAQGNTYASYNTYRFDAQLGAPAVVTLSPYAQPDYSFSYFNRIRGTVAVYEGGGSAVLEIYSGDELLYTSPVLTGKSAPIEIDLPVNWEHDIKLKLTAKKGSLSLLLTGFYLPEEVVPV